MTFSIDYYYGQKMDQLSRDSISLLGYLKNMQNSLVSQISLKPYIPLGKVLGLSFMISPQNQQKSV